ncbi:MAG TPA: DNA alkylation repair protein [Acidimicrobiia bacterium]|nr:DNA alkylation repair protein [Acidimicrobiia bacterium]
MTGPARLHSTPVQFAQEALAAVADPEKAAGMRAYMKTDMPFYGVQKTERTPILRDLVRMFPPSDQADYEGTVLALWALPHREEKYLALGVARHFTTFVTPVSLPLYRRLIVEGAWWDLVDEVATHLICDLVVGYPSAVWPIIDTWIDSEEMWLRRSAIICQVGAKERTDTHRLFRFCAQRAFEQDFFIRKAIGWALRQHARTDPESVARFVIRHEGELSALSYREATKHIGHLIA